MERPEALDTGSIILTGLDSRRILDCISIACDAGNTSRIPEDYQIADTSWRVLKLISGTAGLSNNWHGIKAGLQSSYFEANSKS
jgi:UDP-N-acetylglucosamine 2-epimerase (non-hydrolysing)